MQFLLPMLLTLIAQPAPAKPASTHCVLHIQGSLNHKANTKMAQIRTSETFEYSIPGNLSEVTAPSGLVTFDFVADPKAAEKGTAKLSMKSSTLRKGVMEEIEFTGNKLQAIGTIRFMARARGQSIYPVGSLYVQGLAKKTLLPAANTEAKEEARFMLSQPFPTLDPKLPDAARPEIKFTAYSLWALRNIASDGTLTGSIIYPGGGGGAITSSGQVDIRFVLSK